MENVNVFVIPIGEWKKLLQGQEEILGLLRELKVGAAPATPFPVFLSALEFMKAVGIKRTKFDELVQANSIRIIKKGRKIYVPVGEVERYFK